MAENSQSFQHHTRWHPLYHYVLSPIAIVAVGLAIYRLYQNPTGGGIWNLVVAVAFFLLLLLTRLYPLKVQDRVIRLEETLRMQRLLPVDLQMRIPELTVPQMVGLRFASDGELIDLVQQVLANNLTQKQIKERIKVWRPDHWRV